MFWSRNSPSRDMPDSFPILAPTNIQRDDSDDIDDAPICTIKRSRKDLWKSLRCIVPSTSTSQREDGQCRVPAYDVHELKFPNSDFAEAFADDDLRALWEWKQHAINEKCSDEGGQKRELPSASLDDDDAFIVFSDSPEDESSILHSLPTTEFDCQQDPDAGVYSTSKKTSPAVTDRTYPESEDEGSEKRSAYSGSSISDSSQLVDQIKRVTAESTRVRQQVLPLKDSPSVAKARSRLPQQSGRPPKAESKTQKGPLIVDFNPIAYASGTGGDPTEKNSAKGVEPIAEFNCHGLEQTIPALLKRIRKLEAVLEAEGISLGSEEEGESCDVDDDVGELRIENERKPTSDQSSSSFMADSSDFSHDTIHFSPIRWDRRHEEEDDMKYTHQRFSGATRDDRDGINMAVLDRNKQTPKHKNSQRLDNQIETVSSKLSSSARWRQKGKKVHKKSRAKDRQGNEAEALVPPQPFREAGDQSFQDGAGAEGDGLNLDTLSRFSLVTSWVDYTCGGGFME